jgi:glycosyltransferase involved in cell wall biosynthesis
VRRLLAGRRECNLLTVGRVVPNKGVHHDLAALAALRAGGVDARLQVVGAHGPRAYLTELRRLVDRLGLEDDVVFTGSVSDEELAAHYETADAFLFLSEHEGFGIPLVEALRFGLPVVALAGSATAETAGGAALLVREAEPALVAELVWRVCRDHDLKALLGSRGRERARELEEFPRDEALVGAALEIAGS